jgi:predicted nuclease of predicted toxin-antitoxin system
MRSFPSDWPNSSPDLVTIATAEDRIVITKDEDFVDSHLLRGLPPRLLLISTGNISNQELLKVFQARLPLIESAFHGSSFVELTLIAVVAH